MLETSHAQGLPRVEESVGGEIDHIVPGIHSGSLALVGHRPRQRDGTAREGVGRVRHAAHHQVGRRRRQDVQHHVEEVVVTTSSVETVNIMEVLINDIVAE